MSVSDSWFKAGEIAHRILNKARNEVKPNVRLIEICEKIENMIRAENAKPAFPVNISINEVAAHYTSPPGDKAVIPDKCIVKLDIGVLLDDGAIADTAITIDIGVSKKIRDLVDATRDVLDEAINHVKAGVRVGTLGEIIWKKAHERGFGVLTDLGGHSIEKWNLHSGITIPNIPKMFSPKLKENMIIAIEPFLISYEKDSVTNPDMSNIHIFSIIKHRQNKVLEKLYELFRGMPFSLRWISKARQDPIFRQKLKSILIEEAYRGNVRAYPVLIESNRRWVAQFEHTVLVKANSAEILT